MRGQPWFLDSPEVAAAILWHFETILFLFHVLLHMVPLLKSIVANDSPIFTFGIPEDMQEESVGLICTPHSADKP